MSRTFRWLLSASVLCLLIAGSPVSGQDAREPDPASLWADFNHYVLIARPNLAQAAGQALLQAVDNQQLLDVVEAGDYKDYESNLVRAQRIESLRETATELEHRIQAARIERSRDPQRIGADIDALDEGQRPYRGAVTRLRSAGQYAAPQLLATLQDDSKAHLHPYVIEAMTAIGQPLVAPLSAALVDLDPVPQGQVAQVLAEIGYPQPLPYLKQILEDDGTDAHARNLVQSAYDKLLGSSNVSVHLDAASLYLLLGQQQYRLGTHGNADLPGYDASENKGIVWEYSGTVGLVPVPVPGQIFGDVLAMRSSRRALELNPNLDPALSLYLMANLRRENRLPEGEDDPSYPSDMEPAAYYAMLSGPVRLHDVLAQALDDHDPALALDAIEALAKTAGTDALISQDAGARPLLTALSYPDRRVRFRAAQALANARPKHGFPGAFRVIPVLAEAVRQSENRYALVVAADQQSLNQLLATMNELGYETIGGLSLDDAQSQINSSPGVDIIVTDLNVAGLQSLYRQTADDYKLGAVPILALVQPDSELRVTEMSRSMPRLSPAAATANAEQLRAAVDRSASAYVGKPITAEESTAFALMALRVLREVALGSDVYNIVDAQPALIQALADDRSQIVTGAGGVLSLVNTPRAQRAVADAALQAADDDQLALLDSLAESATFFGDMLDDNQKAKIVALVSDSTGDLAIAAARAHGALTLPTSDAVKEILK